MSDSHGVLTEKLQRAIETGELMDALILAQDLLAEVRRAGNPADDEVAVLLSLTGNLLAERGFVTNALVTLEEADAEWARYPDEPLKLFWLARNSQFRGLALQVLGRHQEAIAASELALATYRAVLLDVEDPAGVEPDEALELITLAVELVSKDARSTTMFNTIAIFIAKCSKDIAHAHLAIGEIGVALPWLDMVYRAIDRVGDAQRPLLRLEAFDGYRVLMATVMTLYSPDEDLPPAVEAAMDRLDSLIDEHVDLSQLPGALSFDSQFQLMQSQISNDDEAEAQATLESMLATFGADEAKRALILMALVKIELRTDGDLEEIERRIAEIMRIADACPEDGVYFRNSCQVYLAEVCFRRGAFEDAKRWAALSLAGLLRLAAGLTLDAAPSQLRQLAEAYRALGNTAASVMLAKLLTGLAAGWHRQLERTAPLVDSNELPSGHREAADRLRGYLIEDGRLGEALTAGLLPTDGALPPMTPAESEAANQFSDPLLTVEEIERIAVEFADADVRHAVDLQTLQQQQLDRFRDVIPWADGTTFLHYNPQPDHLQVVIATAERADTFVVPVSSNDIAISVFDLLRALIDEKPPESNPYDLLIRPLEEHLASVSSRRLVIAGADFLRFLPFAALHDGEKYLVERYQIVSWSPFATSTLKQEPRLHTRVALLGYVRGTGADVYEELASVPAELSVIAATCRTHGRAVRSALDTEFNTQALIDAIGGNADVVHLATHFEADPADAAKLRLVLGDESVVDLGELAKYTAQGSGLDLITLGACGSGLPVASAAEANVSAVAVLHASGARSVVSTLWSVRSASTTLLMEHFYRALFGAESFDKAEALRQAQLALLHGDDGYSDPHHWASFVLSGNWFAFH